MLEAEVGCRRQFVGRYRPNRDRFGRFVRFGVVLWEQARYGQCMNRLYTLILTIGITSIMAHAADLTITVKGVRSAAGAILLAVYDSNESFMKAPQAKTTRRLNSSKGDLKIVIHDLPAGKYAIASYHDENGNGKLDTNALGVPEEGYGFSNDARGALGPPSFSEAVFDFDGKTDKAIAFSIQY
jgi:uncharacterized protein (DUF2141 family)